MSITLEQAKNLKHGDMLLNTITNRYWKVNGKPKTWKRNVFKVRIPVKFGLYKYGYITENELEAVSL